MPNPDEPTPIRQLDGDTGKAKREAAKRFIRDVSAIVAFLAFSAMILGAVQDMRAAMIPSAAESAL